MNIKEAKQEIINTVHAYLHKDAFGEYAIPVEKQRPILLIGPPGIGKTAIMEQVAKECGINLVAYTITHHTRQSAIGLPFISKKNYGGEEYSVTEYTMSEIIASIYDQIERSGIKEGILFLDEINCVSETLAPTMLEFLQYKKFGMHRVPDGFLIVTAGNPPQYNKSVRDFDIVTLDRVKRIDIDVDFGVWKEYAYQQAIHGSILAYLQIKQQNFYSIRTEVEDRYFVTARGWEDLSRIITVYEEMGIPVTKELVVQYLQDPEIAADFASYYELYNKYRNLYRIPQILDGSYTEDNQDLVHARFDEKLSMLGLLNDSLGQRFRAYDEELNVQQILMKALNQLHVQLKNKAASVEEIPAVQILRSMRTAMDEDRKKRLKADTISRREEHELLAAERALSELEDRMKMQLQGSEDAQDPKTQFLFAKDWFQKREEKRRENIDTTRGQLTNCLEFLVRTFGEGQEMVIFLSELSAGYYSLKFIRECGCDSYYKYNRLLLLDDQRSALQDKIRGMLSLT